MYRNSGKKVDLITNYIFTQLFLILVVVFREMLEIAS